ncbi:MAG TPA: PilN domain-containing protein [Stellaceae bacterium]|nr:PilN domain-containing protein [Stellaceae bacterium]
MTIAANRPLDSARPRAGLRRALDWWIGELAACRHDLRARLATQGRRGVVIEAGERYWLLRRGGRPIGQVDRHADGAADLRVIERVVGRRPIVVEIPADRTLAKTIALPPGAKGQLDRILGFEIARHFPFPAEQVHFQHRLVQGERDGIVTVEVVAVPRAVVDEIGAALAALGLRAAAIAVGAGAKPLYLPPAAYAGARKAASRSTRWLGVAAVLAGLAALVSWPLAQQHALDALDRELAALKPGAEAALRVSDGARRAAERDAAILALRGGRPPLVAALDRLSRDLPDGAWLLSLSISGRDVVLDGLAPSGAAVALALEKAGHVSGIVFRAPITREAAGLEHFQLGGTLNGGEVKP